MRIVFVNAWQRQLLLEWDCVIPYNLPTQNTYTQTHSHKHRHTHSLRNNCASRIRLSEFDFIAWPEAKAESGDKAVLAKEAKIKQLSRE